MSTEFIVMTARGKVAVCEVKIGVKPKMISERARGMVRIVSLMNKLHAGGPRTAYGRALEDAERLCRALNREARMLDPKPPQTLAEAERQWIRDNGWSGKQ